MIDLVDESLLSESKKLDGNIQILIQRNEMALQDLDKEIEALTERLQEKEMRHDRSENADYHLVVNTRDMKISVKAILESKLKSIRSSIGDYTPTGTINVGTTVKLRIVSIGGSNDFSDLTKGKSQYIVKVVEDGSSSAELGLLSVESPVAMAILGHRVLDIVSVNTTYGIVKYKIEGVY